MVILAVHLDGQIGADHLRIARRHCCAWPLLKLTTLQPRGQKLKTKWNNLLVVRYAVCKC